MNRDREKEVRKKKIAEFDASGTTIAEFSRAHGFSPNQNLSRLLHHMKK
jgi:hypothetical protein